jgi:hypothetical protein
MMVTMMVMMVIKRNRGGEWAERRVNAEGRG